MMMWPGATTVRLDDALEQALNTEDTQPDYRGRGPSMSMLGGCRRQVWYAGQDVDWAQQHDTSAADVGSSLHRDLLPRIAFQAGLIDEPDAPGQGTVWEVPVVYISPSGIAVPGTADLIGEDYVADLKTVSGWSFITEPRTSWKMQVTAAAVAARKPFSAVIVLNRDTGLYRVFEWVTADESEALAEWVDSTLPEPQREYRGPGVDRQCDWCPFVSHCYPNVEGGEPQAVLVTSDQDVEAFAAMYAEAKQRERDAKADADFARKSLSASSSGRYGRWKITWAGGKPKDQIDWKATLADMELRGVEPITKPGATPRRLTVTEET